MKKLVVCQTVILCIVLASILFSTYHLNQVLTDIRKGGGVENDNAEFERLYMEENLYEATTNSETYYCFYVYLYRL